MKVMLIRTAKGLHGATPDDETAWQAFRRRLEVIKPGSWLRFEYSTPRNGPQHRKMFALFTLITENSETYKTAAQALIAVKLVVGHFDLLAHPLTGEIIPVPKSISYESMPQEEFEVFYEAAINGVIEHILPQFDRATADRLLDMITEGWVK